MRNIEQFQTAASPASVASELRRQARKDRVKRSLLCAVTLVLAACGVSYSLDPAQFVIRDGEHLSRQKILGVVGPILERQGFEDLGIDQEMIDLLEQSPVKGDQRIAELRNQVTYLNRDRNLRVEITDYSDVASRRRALKYQAPAGPFFELSVFEERPGGFSEAGHGFVSALNEELARELESSVAMVTAPPAADQRIYWSTTILNGLALALQWALAFLLTVAITGAGTKLILRRLPISRGAKQGIFVLTNTWLATPLPFPVATLLVILLPHLFAFPWTYADYYRRVQDVAVLSFPISLTLCYLISIWLFPKLRCEGDDA